MLSDFIENNKKYLLIGAIAIGVLILGYIVYSYMKASSEIKSMAAHPMEESHEFCTRDGTCYSHVPSVEEQRKVEQFVAEKGNDPEDDSVEPIESYSSATDDKDE